MGFTEELAAESRLASMGLGPSLLVPVNKRLSCRETKTTETTHLHRCFSLPQLHACNACYGGTSVIFTVTKKARPKQSFDLNFKAWDNKEATYGTTVSAFVGFKGLWEIMDPY